MTTMRSLRACTNLHQLDLMHNNVPDSTPTLSNSSYNMDQQRVIAMTNHGVRLLQQRNPVKATQTMLQALNHLKETSKKRPLPDKTTVVNSEEDCQERRNAFATEHLVVMAETATSESLPFQMFPQVFTFSSPSCDPTSIENRDGSSAMILYNMGVAYHSRGSKLSLSKALQMYNYALAAIQHWARHQVVHQGCHLLRLAILNNMAHVNALLEKNAATLHCLKCLKDILAYAKGTIEQEHFDFFSTNTVLLCMKGGNGALVLAPAAAA